MAQQQQQRRGRTFVTAAVIFHTHIQPGVQLRASVCVCVCQQKDKVTLRFIVVGPFFLVLSTRCPQLFGPHIYKYVHIYVYTITYIPRFILACLACEKMVSFIFHIVKQTTHTQKGPHAASYIF